MEEEWPEVAVLGISLAAKEAIAGKTWNGGGGRAVDQRRRESKAERCCPVLWGSSFDSSSSVVSRHAGDELGLIGKTETCWGCAGREERKETRLV